MGASRPFILNTTGALLLRDLDLDSDAVWRRAGLPQDLLTRQPVRLSPADFYALFQAMEDEYGGPDLALQIGRVISTEMFDPPIFAAMCSPDLRTASRRISKYKALMGPLQLHVEDDEEGTSLQIRFPEPAPPPPAVLYMFEAVFLVALARLATRARVEPTRVILPLLPAPGILPAYASWFGTPVEQGPGFVLSFSQEDATRPFLTANPGMWSFFEPELRRRLSELKADATTTDRVRAALLELLPAGDASMTRVGHTLAMSTRTLQRRLKTEGHSFQTLLAETREALALHYLRGSNMSAAEISFLLGYADPNSFYRAFHEWTGITPETARTRA